MEPLVSHGRGRELRGAGISVWLMRGCGLRIEEALAVEKADFRNGGRTLRVCGQASRNGMEKLPHPKEVEELAASWRPYCSVASWYLWRSLEGPAL